MSDEFARIAALRGILGGGDAVAEVGIGDDAAVLHPFSGKLVASVDAQVEHVHFERAWLGWEDVGYRALMAAASDLAALGAEPLGALSALNLPPDFSDDDLAALARGQQEAALRLACPIVGGNLSRGEELSITTTVLGKVERPLLRAGARAGEGVYLAGRLGYAAAGLRALRSGAPIGDGPTTELALEAFRRPEAQLAASRVARGVATAAIDVSDGLAQDLGHLAEASGVGIDLSLPALPAGICLEDVLFGGEDYALAITAPVDDRALPGFVRIGRVVPALGVHLDGARLEARGHRHFSG